MGHIITVYGAGGGVGCTTVAVNLAVRLCQRDARVLLIDCDRYFGDVGTFLNLHNATTLLDCLRDDLDAELLDTMALRHDSGLHVLPAPRQVWDGDVVKPDQIAHLLDVAQSHYDLIVLDTARQPDDLLLMLLDRASIILLVMTPTLVSVKNARLSLELFDSLGYGEERIVPVLNQVSDLLEQKKLSFAAIRLETFLKRVLEAKLPLDTDAAIRALVRGTPVTTDKSPLAAAFDEFGRYIFRMLVYDADEIPAVSSSPLPRPSPVSQTTTLPDRPLEKPPEIETDVSISSKRSEDSSGETITILLVDPVLENAGSLEKLLAFESDMQVVGTAATGAEALEKVTALKPRIVLIKESIQNPNAFDTTQQIAKSAPTTAVIFLSSTSDLERMRQAMRAGAHHFLIAPVDADQLYSTIRQISSQMRPLRAAHYAQAVLPPTLLAARKAGAAAGAGGLRLRPEPDKAAARGETPTTPKAHFELGDAGSFNRRPFNMGGLPTPVPPAAPSSIPQPRLATVQFTTYYPRQAAVQTRYGLYVYAHVPAALAAVQTDVTRFRDELGGEMPQPRTAKQTPTLAEETRLTVVPEADTLQFEPESLTKRWRGPWTRFDFDFTPPADAADESVLVRLSIQVQGVEVASLKCGIEVIPVSEPEIKAVTLDNPLAAAKLASQQVDPYRKIFISYSRQDGDVARAYQMAQLALGNEVFIDVDGLRAGENWQAALARAIDSADIFQLFWSENYAQSEYCRYEWDYALRYRCPDSACEGFIRPVYWSQPLQPAPPVELSHLNFKFVPFNR